MPLPQPQHKPVEHSGKVSDGRSPALPLPLASFPQYGAKASQSQKGFLFQYHVPVSPKDKAILLVLPPHLHGKKQWPSYPKAAP